MFFLDILAIAEGIERDIQARGGGGGGGVTSTLVCTGVSRPTRDF